jgi:hypothetical protein
MLSVWGDVAGRPLGPDGLGVEPASGLRVASISFAVIVTDRAAKVNSAETHANGQMCFRKTLICAFTMYLLSG